MTFHSCRSGSSGAIAAWDAGATGAGVKIAVIDSGLNAGLNEFAGRIDPASADTAGNRGVSDEGGHGTAVTSIAAAGRNGTRTMGVAFNSTILSFRSDERRAAAEFADLLAWEAELDPGRARSTMAGPASGRGSNEDAR